MTRTGRDIPDPPTPPGREGGSVWRVLSARRHHNAKEPRHRIDPYLVLVVALALLVAGTRLREFLDDPRGAWVGLAHDRNGHYEYAQSLAMTIRSGDPIGFVALLEKAKTWPPLHGLVAALFLSFTGPDYRVAILPSLMAWVWLVIAAFLLARDLSGGVAAAGLPAAALVIASPAYARFSIDVMLESLGAALTMTVVWMYVRARARPAVHTWRAMSVALTLLFFEKYNYWLIAAAGLALAELIRARHAYRGRARELWPIAIGDRRQLRNLLDWRSAIVAATIVLAIIVWLARPAPVHLAGRTVSLYPPDNLTTIAWVTLFWRVIVEMRRRRVRLETILSQRVATILRWHVLPIAVSFLAPRRLSDFTRYLTPYDSQVTHIWTAAPVVYTTAALRDYHASPAVAAVAALLLAVALLRPRSWQSPRAAALAVWTAGLVSVLVHPYLDSRFLHSWLALGWVAGSAAFARLLDVHGDSRRKVTATLAAIGALVVLGTPIRGIERWPERASSGAPSRSALDISDAYLSRLAGASRTAIFSTTPMAQLARWTYCDRYNRRDGVEWPIRIGLDRATLGQAMATWASVTSADAAVFVDIPPGSPDFFPWPSEADRDIGRMIDESGRFAESDRIALQDRAIITIWRRRR